MLLDGLIEVRDDAIADIAVDHDTRARDIDFLYCAIVDCSVRLRLDTASRDIRIADAARAREEMAAGMAEALRRFRQLMQDVPLDARTVVHRNEMERHSLRMAAEVLKVAAVQHPHHLLIGIDRANFYLKHKYASFKWEVSLHVPPPVDFYSISVKTFMQDLCWRRYCRLPDAHEVESGR